MLFDRCPVQMFIHLLAQHALVFGQRRQKPILEVPRSLRDPLRLTKHEKQNVKTREHRLNHAKSLASGFSKA